MKNQKRLFGVAISTGFALVALCSNSIAGGMSIVVPVRTPVTDITTGVQMGATNQINTKQSSNINVLAVTQVGPQSSAFGQQNGKINNATITQVAPVGTPFAGF